MIKLERRLDASLPWTAGSYLAAVLMGFIATAVLLRVSGAEVIPAFTALFDGAFGSRSAIIGSLVKATPLIFTGLATVVAFRAQVWNIGQEGQMFAGVMMAYWAATSLGWLPHWALVIAIIAAGVLGGGLLGGLAGALKARFKVNETISTVMLNYLVIYGLSYLLAGGPWMETGETVSYHQTARLPEPAHLPLLIESTKLHIGFAIALAAALFVFVLFDRTALGFEIRALGLNPTALTFKGTNVGRTMVIVLIISGGIAGLAGIGELFGINHRLRSDYLLGLGYTGIIIGMIGGLRPLGTVIAAIFFGGLASGALYMKILSGVPSALVPAMEGIVLLFFLCAGVIARYRVVRVAADV